MPPTRPAGRLNGAQFRAGAPPRGGGVAGLVRVRVRVYVCVRAAAAWVVTLPQARFVVPLTETNLGERRAPTGPPKEALPVTARPWLPSVVASTLLAKETT